MLRATKRGIQVKRIGVINGIKGNIKKSACSHFQNCKVLSFKENLKGKCKWRWGNNDVKENRQKEN